MGNHSFFVVKRFGKVFNAFQIFLFKKAVKYNTFPLKKLVKCNKIKQIIKGEISLEKINIDEELKYVDKVNEINKGKILKN